MQSRSFFLLSQPLRLRLFHRYVVVEEALRLSSNSGSISGYRRYIQISLYAY